MNEMRADTARTYEERILRVLVHMQHHLDDALDLDELARVAHFSPFHFHRIFRGMVGESVKQHVRRLRLERAAHRLKFSDQPVTRIAFEAGYETHEAFTRRFHAVFGQSPSDFRREHKALPMTEAPSGVHYDPKGDVPSFQPVGGTDPMEVRIEQVPARHAAFMRHVGAYDAVGDTWSGLMAWAGGRGLLGPSTSFFGVVHDDPAVTPPNHLRYDACIEVVAGFVPEGDVGVQEVSGGVYAVTTHCGPYTGFNETYAALCGTWLPASGRELRSAPALEFYRNSPLDTRPNDLITDIYMLLE